MAEAAQDIAGTTGNQASGDALAQRGGIGTRGIVACGEIVAAIRHTDACFQVNTLAVQGSKGSEWHLAGTFKMAVDDALGLHTQGGVGVIQGGKQRVNGTVQAAFDTDGTLADSG